MYIGLTSFHTGSQVCVKMVFVFLLSAGLHTENAERPLFLIPSDLGQIMFSWLNKNFEKWSEIIPGRDRTTPKKNR